jgi:hypothetical protein
MAKKPFLLTSIILVLFPVLGAFSQTTKNSNISINKINKIVKSISEDTNLRATVLNRSNIPNSAIEKFKTHRGSIQQVIAFYSNDTLKQLKIKTGTLYSTETDYYFENRQVIFIIEKYHNNSRMGSCGDLDIENRLYYSSQKLIRVETIEIPFKCYNEEVESDLILADLNKILTFLNIYETKNFR